jgi:transcriptional regulator with XRE-family HTH domain
MSDSFGARLRYERERRQIALRSIAEGTKISASLLEGLERDDVSRWPSGIFRKSFVRAYAEAIGLDPDPVVREFVERYPDPLEVDVVAPVNPRSVRPTASAEATAGRAEARMSHASDGGEPDRPSSPSGPLSIKLTITWSGSVHHTIGRLADWRIVRMLFNRRLAIGGVESANQHSSL